MRNIPRAHTHAHVCLEGDSDQEAQRRGRDRALSKHRNGRSGSQPYRTRLPTCVTKQSQAADGKRTVAPLRVSLAVNLLQRIVRVNAKYGYKADLARALTRPTTPCPFHAVCKGSWGPEGSDCGYPNVSGMVDRNGGRGIVGLETCGVSTPNAAARLVQPNSGRRCAPGPTWC